MKRRYDVLMKKAHTGYHKDGTLWSKGFFDGDVMVGHWEWFRKDGTVMRAGHFENGKQAGTWTTFDAKGRIVKVTDFDKKKSSSPKKS